MASLNEAALRQVLTQLEGPSRQLMEIAAITQPRLYAMESLLLTINLTLMEAIDPCTGCTTPTPCGHCSDVFRPYRDNDTADFGNPSVFSLGDQWAELDSLHGAVVEVMDAITYARDVFARGQLLTPRSLTGRIPCVHRPKHHA